jgi:hypothetical protein
MLREPEILAAGIGLSYTASSGASSVRFFVVGKI